MDITGTVPVGTPPVPQPQKPVADAELVEATRQFEAIFLRQFLGDALKPLLHATPGSEGPGSGFYQYMMTDVISTSLTQQEQFGISSLLQMELSGQLPSRLPTSDNGEHAGKQG